jgi:YVTN family beta-propeller protein
MPFAIAITPDGKTVYVVNRDNDTVTPVDVATNTAGAPISVGDRPIGIAITPTWTPEATATTTTFSVIKTPLPLGLGGVVIPTASVAPPTATGTVQFRAGTANLGGPVRVVGGRAIGPVTFLPKGSHSLTAVFTPTNPAEFTSSTSNTVTVIF